MTPPGREAQFSWRGGKDGTVTIFWHGKPVTVLRGANAARFLARIDGASEEVAQLVMAKATGNFKRGNERLGKSRRS